MTVKCFYVIFHENLCRVFMLMVNLCRVRFGYAHVVNNLYQGWGLYAIGGSMNPSVKSQANLFIAPKTGNKEVNRLQQELALSHIMYQTNI